MQAHTGPGSPLGCGKVLTGRLGSLGWSAVSPRAGTCFSKELTEQDSGGSHLTLSNGKETQVHLQSPERLGSWDEIQLSPQSCPCHLNLTAGHLSQLLPPHLSASHLRPNSAACQLCGLRQVTWLLWSSGHIVDYMMFKGIFTLGPASSCREVPQAPLWDTPVLGQGFSNPSQFWCPGPSAGPQGQNL